MKRVPHANIHTKQVAVKGWVILIELPDCLDPGERLGKSRIETGDRLRYSGLTAARLANPDHGRVATRRSLMRPAR